MAELPEIAGLARFPLARRRLMTSGLVTGLTLATTRVEAQEITTDTKDLSAGEIHIALPGGEMPAYYARPSQGGPFPIVLVVEEIFGVHHYIRDICRRLAKLGFLGIAPELYWRYPALASMTSSQQIAREVIAKTPDSSVIADLDTAASWAAGHRGDGQKLALIGFCRGGRGVWLYAAEGAHPGLDLRAAVAWYGPLGGPRTPVQPHTALDVAAEIQCPLLGLYGGEDPSSTPAEISEAETRAGAAGKTVEIVVYPEAPHGFHADYRPSYRKADAEDSWKRMLAWFYRYGIG